VEEHDSENAAFAAVQRAQTAWWDLSEQHAGGQRSETAVAEVVGLLLAATQAAIASSRDNDGANTRLTTGDVADNRHLLIPLEVDQVECAYGALADAPEVATYLGWVLNGMAEADEHVHLPGLSGYIAERRLRRHACATARRALDKALTADDARAPTWRRRRAWRRDTRADTSANVLVSVA
jgi:hypothetical protein